MTFTIMTQKINAFDSEPKDLEMTDHDTFASALAAVVDHFGEDAAEGLEASDLEPVDTGTCLVLHRMGAIQAWRVQTSLGPLFVAIVGSPS
jgi:hypothetical protein